MPPSNRQPVDITGLKDALDNAQVDVCEEIAAAKATLKSLREKAMAGEEPTKADMFAASLAVKTIQSAAALIKVRPELVGKSAGKVSGAELLGGDSHATSSTQQSSRDKAAMLPPPRDWGSEEY
jgi:hypothetical protein